MVITGSAVFFMVGLLPFSVLVTEICIFSAAFRGFGRCARHHNLSAFFGDHHLRKREPVPEEPREDRHLSDGCVH